ncbi:MAG: hypothetical protein MK198_13730 [Gracilimonas sp.]|uniref:ABC-three component system middle component 1 n=1 Tax=Gracilimonas sp. TaxID=1974203 RepID=UPI0037526898|nr:hypothetical protein [Gracilimonas sp.]
MEDFIQKLFKEYEFADPFTEGDFLFFQRPDEEQVEYYLVQLVNSNDLKSFLENENIEELLSFFNEQKTKSPDIEKNTTLLVLAQVENLDKENHNLVKRNIWKIEEDEYFFNKSVILYDGESENMFSGNSSLIEQLETTVLEDGKLDAFLKNNFDDKHYFFCLQLFIKIPFLKPPILTEEFTDLKSIIDNKLTANQKDLSSLLDSSILKELSDIKDGFLDTTNEDVDEFLKKFPQENETD